MIQNLKVRTQFMALSGVSLTLFVAALIIAIFALRASQTHFQTYIAEDAKRLAALNDMYAQGLQSGQALRNIILDPNNRKAYDNLDKAIADFDAAMRRVKDLSAKRSDIAALIDRLQASVQAQQAARTAVLAEVSAGRSDEAKNRLNKDETPAWRALKKELGDAIDQLSKEADQLEQQMAVESESKQRLIVGVAVVAALAMLFISVTIARNLMRQLGGEPAEVARLATRIAQGDLTDHLAVAPGDRSSLMAAFVEMQKGLVAMVSASQRSAHDLKRAAEELKASAQIGAQATEAQSEAASGMAAAVQQTSVSIDQVRDSTGEASRMAIEAGKASRAGAQVVNTAADGVGQVATAVHDAAASIRELENYSSEISAVVSVIREVADQTNLLALNAAIEAARAGEQGRGFAVVADEVRKLAERTSESTHTIATVIDKVQVGARKAAQEMEGGVARVNDGVELTRQAGQSITSIQGIADQVTATVTNINDALVEQASAAQQIARGVEQIANMAEESSASARQTTVAAEQLNVLAAQLESAVARFRI